jgi:hypothetical protein
LLFSRKRKALPKMRKHEYPIPNVYFTNTLDDDSSINYNCVGFDNDVPRSPGIPSVKTKEPMYDEEFLVYDKQPLND